MTTYRFDRITATRRKSGKCPVCGRRTTRSHTVEMTVNPFNKNADGTVKSPAEVRRAAEAKADLWVPDFHHAACAEAAS